MGSGLNEQGYMYTITIVYHINEVYN